MGKRKEVIEKDRGWARKAFANHVIKKRTACSWYCKSTEGNAYWFEVLLGVSGSIIVHGDIDTVVFSRCENWKDAIPALGWMGGTDDLYYVAQKARMGICVSEDTDADYTSELDAEVFIEDVREHLDTYYCDSDVPEWFEQVIGWACSDEELRERLRFDAHELPQEATEDGLIWSFGRIPSTRLIYAHEAVKWLWMTLQGEQQPEPAELSDEEAKAEEERANAAV